MYVYTVLRYHVVYHDPEWSNVSVYGGQQAGRDTFLPGVSVALFMWMLESLPHSTYYTSYYGPTHRMTALSTVGVHYPSMDRLVHSTRHPTEGVRIIW